MTIGLPSGSVQIRRIIYGGESEPIPPVFYDDISDASPNSLVLDTVLEYDPLIKIDGYSWNGIRNVPVSNSDPIGDALRADSVGYWKMDETSESRADSTGHGWNLIEFNPTLSVTGKISNAVKLLDNANDLLSPVLYNDDFTADITNGFSIFGWVNIPQLNPADDGNFYIFGNVTPGAGDTLLQCGILVPNENPVGIYVDGISGEVSINEWHFFVYSNDGTTSRLYIDNAFIGQSNYTKTNPFRAVEWIGTANFANNTDYIVLDEMGFINRIITSDERQYLFNSGAGRTLYP